MEYTLSLDRCKSRTNSLTALKKVEQIMHHEQKVHSFLNSEILAYPEEINYGLFLRREASNTSITRIQEDSPRELNLPRPKLVPIIERYPRESLMVIPPEPLAPSTRPQTALVPVAEEQDLMIFGRVICLLKRIFKIERVEDFDFELQDYEHQILAAIIRRKYGQALQKSHEARISSQVASVLQQPSKKRPEEKYKFVFKRAFKLLKERFAQDAKAVTKTKASTAERAFYEFYFQEYAARHRLPLEKYYNPKNSTAKDSNYHKTISIDYVNLIKESPAFVCNFMAALDQIITSCDGFIDSKLRSLGLRFVEFYTRKPDAYMHEIGHYIAKNAKCKLPWTKKEVAEAVEIVTKLFV